MNPSLTLGGPGSGNFGHEGRPGQIGGSGDQNFSTFADASRAARAASLSSKVSHSVRKNSDGSFTVVSSKLKSSPEPVTAKQRREENWKRINQRRAEQAQTDMENYQKGMEAKGIVSVPIDPTKETAVSRAADRYIREAQQANERAVEDPSRREAAAKSNRWAAQQCKRAASSLEEAGLTERAQHYREEAKRLVRQQNAHMRKAEGAAPSEVDQLRSSAEKAISAVRGKKIDHDTYEQFRRAYLVTEQAANAFASAKLPKKAEYYRRLSKQFKNQVFDFSPPSELGKSIGKHIVNKFKTGRVGNKVYRLSSEQQYDIPIELNDVPLELGEGNWITINGTHVLIHEGESKDEAAARFVSSKKSESQVKKGMRGATASDLRRAAHTQVGYKGQVNKGRQKEAFERQQKRQSKSESGDKPASYFHKKAADMEKAAKTPAEKRAAAAARDFANKASKLEGKGKEKPEGTKRSVPPPRQPGGSPFKKGVKPIAEKGKKKEEEQEEGKKRVGGKSAGRKMEEKGHKAAGHGGSLLRSIQSHGGGHRAMGGGGGGYGMRGMGGGGYLPTGRKKKRGGRVSLHKLGKSHRLSLNLEEDHEGQFMIDVGPTSPALVLSEKRTIDGKPVQRFRKEIIRCGKFTKAKDNVNFEVTPSSLNHWVATFNQMKQNGVKVYFPAGHTNKPEANRGWWDKLEVGPSKADPNVPALYGEVDAIGEDGIGLIGRTDVSLYSPPELVDGQGNRYDRPIVHIAACTDPVIPGLGEWESVAASLTPWNPEDEEAELQLAQNDAQPLLEVLAVLLAQRQNYHSSHWATSGKDFYEYHLLFERLYNSVAFQIDTLGEKVVAASGGDAVDPAELNRKVQAYLDDWSSETDFVQRGIRSEEDLQEAIEVALDGASPGAENLLQQLADDHETNQYLLGSTKEDLATSLSLSQEELLLAARDKGNRCEDCGRRLVDGLCPVCDEEEEEDEDDDDMEYSLAGEWEEEEHPRGEGGRFASKGSGDRLEYMTAKKGGDRTAEWDRKALQDALKTHKLAKDLLSDSQQMQAKVDEAMSLTKKAKTPEDHAKAGDAWKKIGDIYSAEFDKAADKFGTSNDWLRDPSVNKLASAADRASDLADRHLSVPRKIAGEKRYADLVATGDRFDRNLSIKERDRQARELLRTLNKDQLNRLGVMFGMSNAGQGKFTTPESVSETEEHYDTFNEEIRSWQKDLANFDKPKGRTNWGWADDLPEMIKYVQAGSPQKWKGKDVHSLSLSSEDLIEPTVEDRRLGAKAKHEFDKEGKNPASWVTDEAAWDKAKEQANKGDYDEDSYWAVVTHIYKNITGGEGYKGPRQSARKYNEARGTEAPFKKGKKLAASRETEFDSTQGSEDLELSQLPQGAEMNVANICNALGIPLYTVTAENAEELILGGITEMQEDFAEKQKTLSLSRESKPADPVVVGLVNENRTMKLNNLIEGGCISPAVGRELGKIFNDPTKLALSLSGGDDHFDIVVKILAQNQPVELKEKSGVQSLHGVVTLSQEGAEPENVLLKDAEEKRKKAKEQADQVAACR